MARIFEPTAEQEAGYAEWVASRPEAIRAVAERLNPWTLYRMEPTGQRVTVVSLAESEEERGRVTLTVSVSSEFNLTMFDRNVFGVDPNSLTPCDLPDSDEPLGAMFTPTQVDENIDALRVMVRPDLWEMDDTGTARRRQ